MTLVLIAVVAVAVAVGVFIFVKHNPNKTAQIDKTANQIVNKAETVAQDVAKKL
jgi:hypothetical protein